MTDVISTIDEQDTSLVRIVHKETRYSKSRNSYTISAMITRFGDLQVFASCDDPAVQARDGQFDNILVARYWVRNQP